ncbi:MAG: YukJ family protein [bacterium]|nr:YukJ family protein [bacterium]
MPLPRYGVLKGKAINARIAVKPDRHYHIHLVTGEMDFRASVNVHSSTRPSELEYLVLDGFEHPLHERLEALPAGFTTIKRNHVGLGLDYVRGGMVERAHLVPLPFDVPGPDNDLNEMIDFYVQKAIASDDSVVYAFGDRWGPEPQTPDWAFGFLPGNGIHDIHMNQGNKAPFTRDDGVWQDGALFIQLHEKGRARWIGIFLKFQSQSWYTHDRTGHSLHGVEEQPSRKSRRHQRYRTR